MFKLLKKKKKFFRKQTPSPEAFAAAIDEKTKAIYVESIANSKYLVGDIPALAKVLFSFASVIPG